MSELFENACALWFWRNCQMEFEICETEEEAAKTAASMVEYEQGSPVGVQYSDGRIVKAEDWEAFKAAEENFDRTVINPSVTPPRPMRLILNPFDGSPKRVDADEPFWLGVRPESLIKKQN